VGRVLALYNFLHGVVASRVGSGAGQAQYLAAQALGVHKAVAEITLHGCWVGAVFGCTGAGVHMEIGSQIAGLCCSARCPLPWVSLGACLHAAWFLLTGRVLPYS
jgi:hypothetical protein